MSMSLRMGLDNAPLFGWRRPFISLAWHRAANSGHAAWHEATDGRAEIAPQRPYHGSADPVRFGDHGFVGHIDPFAIEPHAIVSVAGLPTSLTAVPSASEHNGPL